MSRLFIIGAGGFGREVYSWLRHMPEWHSRWQFAGFLDDRAEALTGTGFSAAVTGSIRDIAPAAGDEFVCGIGDPRTRLAICRNLQTAGALFPVIRHPSAVVGECCRIGQGSILCPGVVLTANVILGEFVVANLGATVGHDAVIGDGVTLSPHADVTGYAVVEEGAFLGAHAVVIPSARVGSYAKVGAGSVVLKSVAAGATVFGVPAKQISP